MSDGMIGIRNALRKRAAKLDEIIEGGKVYPTVLAKVQRAAASLRLCSDMLGEMSAAVLARAKDEDERLAAAKKSQSKLVRVTQFTAYLTQWNLGSEGQRLMEAVQLIAEERDPEAYKALGKQAAMTVAKIGMILSGLEPLKLIEEFISTAMDVYETGQSMKLRKNQVKLASDLMLWLDAVSLVCLTWTVQAQGLILRAQGSFDATTDDQIIERVTARILDLATKKTP